MQVRKGFVQGGKPSYNAASQIIQAAIQKALTTTTTPKQALDDAAAQVAKL